MHERSDMYLSGSQAGPALSVCISIHILLRSIPDARIYVSLFELTRLVFTDFLPNASYLGHETARYDSFSILRSRMHRTCKNRLLRYLNIHWPN